MRSKIILGSASPRRQQLLRECGFSFEVMVKETDESYPAELRAADIALFLADKKAAAFREEMDDDKIFITADTIVWLNDRVLGKPGDRNDAIKTLKLLSDNRHEVYTGICVSSKEKKKTFSVRSAVFFQKLSDDQISYYLDHYHSYDKAGAYGAQECLPQGMNPCSEQEKNFMKKIGKDLFEKTKSNSGDEQVSFIDHIEGSYFNVMGLPVVELYDYLKAF